MQLMGIVRSPVIDGYRNKSEFTVGLDTNGEPSVVLMSGSLGMA